MSLLVTLFNIAILASLVWWMQRQNWAKQLRPYFYPALGLKLLCGVLLGLLYFEYYGGGDTAMYHNRALQAREIFTTSGSFSYFRYLFLDEIPAGSPLATMAVPYYSSAWNTVKLVSIAEVWTGGNYYLSCLYLSFFSFCGLWYLVDALTTYFPDSGLAAVLAFLFLPSVTFWSSGMLKESVIMGGMGFLVGSFLHMYLSERISKRTLAIILFGAFMIWMVKYFVAVALVATLLLAFLLKYMVRSGWLRKLPAVGKLLLICALFSGFALLASRLNYNLGFDQLPITVYQNYIKYNAISEDRPSLEFYLLQPTYLSFILHAPLAFLGAVYRPFVWESYNLITLFASTENLVLLLITLGFLSDVIRKKTTRITQPALVIAVVLYIIIMGILLAYSMPNLGTLSRYRIVFLPFLAYMLLLSPTNVKVLKQISSFKKKK